MAFEMISGETDLMEGAQATHIAMWFSIAEQIMPLAI
jgi:hypothetical protein